MKQICVSETTQDSWTIEIKRVYIVEERNTPSTLVGKGAR